MFEQINRLIDWLGLSRRCRVGGKLRLQSHHDVLHERLPFLFEFLVAAVVQQRLISLQTEVHDDPQVNLIFGFSELFPK